MPSPFFFSHIGLHPIPPSVSWQIQLYKAQLKTVNALFKKHQRNPFAIGVNVSLPFVASLSEVNSASFLVVSSILYFRHIELLDVLRKLKTSLTLCLCPHYFLPLESLPPIGKPRFYPIWNLMPRSKASDCLSRQLGGSFSFLYTLRFDSPIEKFTPPL